MLGEGVDSRCGILRAVGVGVGTVLGVLFFMSLSYVFP